MLTITDNGIVLSLREMQEKSVLARVFCEREGLYAGAVWISRRAGTRSIFQAGNLVQMTWKARLAEHMGSLTGESVKAYGSLLMTEREAASAMVSALTLVEMAIPEREPHPFLFAALKTLLDALAEGERDWLEKYIRFEMDLLRECGFRLDLSHCAATGVKEDLVYVSPKSGRAVCREAGEPYHDKMLPLPAFLLTHEAATSGAEIRDALGLTGHFLEHWLLEPHGRELPAARSRLLSMLVMAPA